MLGAGAAACAALTLAATVVNQTAASPVAFPLRGIHVGGNWGTNTAAVNDWHAGRTDTIVPADYIAWLRRLQVSWVGISVALTYDDSTVERNHDHAARDDASLSDDALRQIIGEPWLPSAGCSIGSWSVRWSRGIRLQRCGDRRTS